MKVMKYFAVFMLFALLGCASAPVDVVVSAGDRPDEIPPRLVMGHNNTRIWDRPEAFGPVPDSKQKQGQKACGPNKKAIGYHPYAKDEKGYAIPKGCYLCVPDK